MDVGNGGGMKIEKQQAEVAAPELEPLKNPSPEDIERIMNSLGYDALNDRRPDDRHESRVQTSREKLYRNFHAAGMHGELFILRGDDGEPVGLLGLRADTPNATGHITLLRTATHGKMQVDITERLLVAAEHYLRQNPRNCTKAIIEGPNPSEHLRMAARHGARQHFYHFQEESSEAANDNEPPTVLEKAA